jgi:hypothetical protein
MEVQQAQQVVCLPPSQCSQQQQPKLINESASTQRVFTFASIPHWVDERCHQQAAEPLPSPGVFLQQGCNSGLQRHEGWQGGCHAIMYKLNIGCFS